MTDRVLEAWMCHGPYGTRTPKQPGPAPPVMATMIRADKREMRRGVKATAFQDGNTALLDHLKEEDEVKVVNALKKAANDLAEATYAADLTDATSDGELDGDEGGRDDHWVHPKYAALNKIINDAVLEFQPETADPSVDDENVNPMLAEAAISDENERWVRLEKDQHQYEVR